MEWEVKCEVKYSILTLTYFFSLHSAYKIHFFLLYSLYIATGDGGVYPDWCIFTAYTDRGFWNVRVTRKDINIK